MTIVVRSKSACFHWMFVDSNNILCAGNFYDLLPPLIVCKVIEKDRPGKNSAYWSLLWEFLLNFVLFGNSFIDQSNQLVYSWTNLSKWLVITLLFQFRIDLSMREKILLKLIFYLSFRYLSKPIKWRQPSKSFEKEFLKTYLNLCNVLFYNFMEKMTQWNNKRMDFNRYRFLRQSNY